MKLISFDYDDDAVLPGYLYTMQKPLKNIINMNREVYIQIQAKRLYTSVMQSNLVIERFWRQREKIKLART